MHTATSHDSYTDHALAILREKGLRITQARKHVVALLAETPTPVSAYEIRDALQAAGEKVDVVSVYRILDCLEEQQLIHRLVGQPTGSAKVIRCRLDHEDHCHREQPDHCHHLLVCEACGTIDEIHCVGLSPVMKDIQQQTGFKTRRHTMELAGRCARC